MVGSTSVGRRLRAMLEESRLSGFALPDEAAWLRRLPAHAEEVRRVFTAWREAHGAAPDPGTHAALLPLQTTAKDPEPAEELRRGAHGCLWKEPNGSLRWVLPAARLSGRNPATEYLARARRLETAAVLGVQTASIKEDTNGDAHVAFVTPQGDPVHFGMPVARRRGATRRTLEIMGRVAARIRTLHQHDAAHGRLTGSSILLDQETQRLVVTTGLDDGPGLDGDSLEHQQIADLKALGALLFGALSMEGQEPDVKEILDRHDAKELPSLRVRRPDLSPALVRMVERALASGRPGGFTSASELLQALDRICDHETELVPHLPIRRSRRRLALTAAALVLACAFSACHFMATEDGQTAHLNVRDGHDPRDPRIERIEELLDDGRSIEAWRIWHDLEREIGLSPR